MGFYNNNDNKSVNATPVVTDNTPGITNTETQTILSPDELLTDRKYVINTQNNATGVNTGRLNTVVADLKGFAEGSLIQVTYYKEHYSETDIKGKGNVSEVNTHPVHHSILKIHGFEMKMSGSLQYEHDTDEQVSKLSGEAFTYPGFNPSMGDQFVMEIDTGTYALMRITSLPTRMSIRAATYFKIQFTQACWMSETEAAELEKRVVDEAWFDKKRFLNEPGALLYHDEYVEINFLKHQRAKMARFHQAKFLDDSVMYSYMRPDEVYDPYVADFMNAILDYSECKHLATQLYEGAPYLKSSIWSALLDNNIPLEEVPTTSETATYALGSKSVLVNSLMNKKYLVWEDSTCLQDYLKDAEEADAVYVKQNYPDDFEVTSTTYALTTDTTFMPFKVYYTRTGTGSHTLQTDTTAVFLADKQYSYYNETTEEYVVMTAVTTDPDTYEYVPGTTKFGDKDYDVYLDDPFVYTAATVTIGETVTPNTYYEKTCTYGWKTNTYYTRDDGVFNAVDKTVVTVPLSTVQYYINSEEDTTTTTTTTSTTTSTSTSTTSDIPEPTSEDEILGDLLLHMHPHYSECPLASSSSSASGTTGDGIDYVLDGTNDHIDLLRNFLLYRKIDLGMLHTCIENVWKLDKLQQFYKMPIYIWLATVAMRNIHHEEGIFER